MKRVALSLTWLTFALCLYSLFWLVTRASGSVGFTTILPCALLGIVLVVHHTKLAKPGAIWTAFVLNAIWGILGLLVLLVSLGTGQPTVKWGLVIGALTLGPAIPNALVLYGRRNEWTVAADAV